MDSIISRLYDTRVCSPAQNYCRNAAVMEEAAGRISALELRCERYREALKSIVEAKALSGVRDQVAGWNGDNKADGPYSPHPRRLGAVLPKTNCGAIYDLDDALEKARAALSEEAGSDGT